MRALLALALLACAPPPAPAPDLVLTWSWRIEDRRTAGQPGKTGLLLRCEDVAPAGAVALRWSLAAAGQELPAHLQELPCVPTGAVRVALPPGAYALRGEVLDAAERPLGTVVRGASQGPDFGELAFPLDVRR